MEPLRSHLQHTTNGHRMFAATGISSSSTEIRTANLLANSLCLLFFSFGAPIPVAAQNEPLGAVVDGIEIRLIPEADTFFDFEPLRLTLQIRNTTAEGRALPPGLNYC